MTTENTPIDVTLQECEEYLALRKIPSTYRTTQQQIRYEALVEKLCSARPTSLEETATS